MNILVLHGFKDLSLARNTSLNHLYAFERYAPEHEYVYHCAYWHVTEQLKQINFCAIILDTSFMSQRTVRPRKLLDELRAKYTWLRYSRAIKLALPQDEYDECDVLDEWLEEMGVDVIGTVVGHRETLYPRMLHKAEFIELLTGYVDYEELLRIESFVKPMASRTVDIGYRGRALPYYFGRLGQQKTEIYRQFKKATAGKRIITDMKISSNGALFGDEWRKFLCNSRFTLGLLSGSSMRDPRGKIRDQLEKLLLERPNTTFDEAEREIFPSEDGQYIFSAISPRIFEAAAGRSCQILIEGHYAEGFKANLHYIPLKPDYSNVDEILERLNDHKEAELIADRCYDLLIRDQRYHYGSFVSIVLGKIQELQKNSRREIMRKTVFRKMLKQHQRNLSMRGKGASFREDIKQKIIIIANSNPILLSVFNVLLRVWKALLSGGNNVQR
ncbi:hypothetical protein OAD74_07725 [Alphaproteobacteria bacterium]|nr:hypothetical protein [Alphaproteobacteria bacterium]